MCEGCDDCGCYCCEKFSCCYCYCVRVQGNVVDVHFAQHVAYVQEFLDYIF